MKRTNKVAGVILLAGLVGLAVLAGGCNAHQSAMEGYDMLDIGLANLETGVTEQASDDTEHRAAVEANLARGFADDVVGVAGDEVQVRAKTKQFVAALNRNATAFEVKAVRRKNMIGTLKAMRQIVGLERTMQQIRLGWKTEAINYSDRLRDLLFLPKQKETGTGG